jgi:hypothetical protein
MVNMVTLPEPQSGAKRPKLTTPKIYQTIKALAILRCLYGSEMVLLGMVIGKCEMPLIFHKKMTMQHKKMTMQHS